MTKITPVSPCAHGPHHSLIKLRCLLRDFMAELLSFRNEAEIYGTLWRVGSSLKYAIL